MTTTSRRAHELRNLGVLPLLPLWVAAAWVAWRQVSFYWSQGTVALDAHAYWLTGHVDHLYTAAPGDADAYLYSPAFAQLIWPLTQLPFPVFAALWIGAEVAAFWWLLAPLGWRWAVPLLLLCSFETVLGNVYGWFGVVAVVGVTRAAAWCAPALTKITPGVGVLWFAARKDWRGCAVAAGVTLVVVAVSVAISPAAWGEWLNFLTRTPHGDQTALRLIIAAALVVIGAHTGKSWLLVPAMILASPVVAINTLTLAAALPRLSGTRVAAPSSAPNWLHGRATHPAPNRRSVASAAAETP